MKTSQWCTKATPSRENSRCQRSRRPRSQLKMVIHTRRSICPSRSSRPAQAGADEGVVLLIVMIVATLLLVALTAAAPRVYQQGQREREAELIFRGTQYARAVNLFHRQFGRYPQTIKELLG